MNKFFAFFVFLVLLASSCKDPCDDVNCNDGICLEGTCICDDGFEGVNCDKEEREKFVGTWVGNMDCGDLLGENEATIVVENDPADQRGILFSLGFDILPIDPLSGTVAGDQFFITSSTQSLDVFGQMVDVTISGDGQMNEDGTADVNLTITAAFGVFNCSGVLSPQ